MLPKYGQKKSAKEKEADAVNAVMDNYGELGKKEEYSKDIAGRTSGLTYGVEPVGLKENKDRIDSLLSKYSEPLGIPEKKGTPATGVSDSSEFYKPTDEKVENKNDNFLGGMSGTAGNKSATVGALQTAGKAVGGILSELEASQAKETERSFAQKQKDWADQGAYWFDPNNDVKPDLEKMMQSMPSATDATYESSLFAKHEKNNYTDPIGFGIGRGGDKKSQYIYATSQQAAIDGLLSGGNWLNMAIGGVMGIVKGIVTWDNAERLDAENRARLKSKYDEAVKNWSIRQNKKAAAQATETAEKIEAVGKRKRSEQSELANTKKSVIMGIIKSASGKNGSFNLPTFNTSRYNRYAKYNTLANESIGGIS